MEIVEVTGCKNIIVSVAISMLPAGTTHPLSLYRM